jgi:hypothetical protein
MVRTLRQRIKMELYYSFRRLRAAPIWLPLEFHGAGMMGGQMGMQPASGVGAGMGMGAQGGAPDAAIMNILADIQQKQAQLAALLSQRGMQS